MTDLKTYPKAMKPAWNDEKGLSRPRSATHSCRAPSGRTGTARWWSASPVSAFTGAPVGNRLDLLKISADGWSPNEADFPGRRSPDGSVLVSWARTAICALEDQGETSEHPCEAAVELQRANALPRGRAFAFRRDEGEPVANHASLDCHHRLVGRRRAGACGLWRLVSEEELPCLSSSRQEEVRPQLQGGRGQVRQSRSARHMARKIRRGGTGVWGQDVMPPQPQVSPAEARELARYVLSLK